MLSRTLLAALFCFTFASAYSQTAEFSTPGGGFWDDASKWVSTNIGDDISEDVLITVSTVYIRSSNSYTIGNLEFTDNGGLGIDPGCSLNVGASGNPKNLIAGDNVAINGGGTIIIWGDLIINDGLSLSVTGTLIVKGNVVLDDGARIFVNGGDLTVEGNFEGGNDTDMSISLGGTVTVEGSLEVGNNSSLTGTGAIFVGTCNQGTSSNYCGNFIMPIKLQYFRLSLEGDIVFLNWATEMEDRFDRFEIEKASNDLVFTKIAQIQSIGGNQPESLRKYQSYDDTPFYGNNYYRLKAVDLDGSFEYFKVESVFFEGDNAISIYPNPALVSEMIKVEVPFTPTPQDNVQLLNIQGVEMLHTNIKTIGINEIALNGKVQPGLYLLRYNSPAFQKTFKIVVK